MGREHVLPSLLFSSCRSRMCLCRQDHALLRRRHIHTQDCFSIPTPTPLSLLFFLVSLHSIPLCRLSHSPALTPQDREPGSAELAAATRAANTRPEAHRQAHSSRSFDVVSGERLTCHLSPASSLSLSLVCTQKTVSFPPPSLLLLDHSLDSRRRFLSFLSFHCSCWILCSSPQEMRSERGIWNHVCSLSPSKQQSASVLCDCLSEGVRGR